MSVDKLKQALIFSVFGVAILLGISGVASAQNNRQTARNDERREDYERERRERARERSLERLRQEQIYRQQDILEQQRIDVERIEQFREEQRQKNQNNRYRVYLDGREFQMDYDGSELLKQAINSGYQQGFQNSKDDHKAKLASDFAASYIYQNATYDYQSDVVSLDLYQHYFREGFQRGYEDGYKNQKQYGKSTNGIRFISDTVSQQILNLEVY